MNTSYYVEQYLQHAGWPKYNKLNNTYNACCPICREGNSWGKKKRSYLLVDKEVVCCHNCGWYGSAINWIMQVAGLTYEEVVANTNIVDVDKPVMTRATKPVTGILPADAINLFDSEQVKYWRNSHIVRSAIKYIVGRKLHIACNKPPGLYISLSDPTHKNRICIPFTNNGTIVHYQTRGYMPRDLESRPKYLSKLNSEKTLFNIDNVDTRSNVIYIVEGPIDSFFIKNSVAVAGIQPTSSSIFTDKQLQQIRQYVLHDHVWCLDSQYADETSLSKTRQLIESGEAVFIWPEDLGKQYKDFNDYCIGKNVTEFPKEILKNNTYTGESAMLRLSTVELDLRRSGAFSVLSGFSLRAK